MKYILYSVLVFVVFSGIPVFLREKQSRIVADTISTAWHQREFEKRAARGARILRAIYKITPELTIPFDSVIASADGDICYFIRTSDARQSPDLECVFFTHDARGVQFGLEFADCGGQV